MKSLGSFAVGATDLVVGGGGGDANHIVEGDIGAFVQGDLIANTEDFLVLKLHVSDDCQDGSSQCDGDRTIIPSLDQAALNGVRRAKKPREKVENFIVAYQVGADNECGVYKTTNST